MRMIIGKKTCVQGIRRWYRIVLTAILVMVWSVGVAKGQVPQLHGVLRGKVEYVSVEIP